MQKRPHRGEFVLDGAMAHHEPTGIEVWFPYPDQAGCDRSVTYRRGNVGEYDEGDVVRFGAELLHMEVATWNCPLCGGAFPKEDRAAVVREYERKCKLKEHSVGYECLAFRQEARARELLTESAQKS